MLKVQHAKLPSLVNVSYCCHGRICNLFSTPTNSKTNACSVEKHTHTHTPQESTKKKQKSLRNNHQIIILRYAPRILSCAFVSFRWARNKSLFPLARLDFCYEPTLLCRREHSLARSAPLLSLGFSLNCHGGWRG